jgi:hypothetical protein
MSFLRPRCGRDDGPSQTLAERQGTRHGPNARTACGGPAWPVVREPKSWPWQTRRSTTWASARDPPLCNPGQEREHQADEH